MIRPFEGFDWGAMALLSKAPEWNGDDYTAVAERIEQGLLAPAASLAHSLAAPLGERLGRTVVVDKNPISLGPVDGHYHDYVLVDFDVGAGDTGPQRWLRIRIGHDLVGFACGTTLTGEAWASWQAKAADQKAITGALAHHPTLTVIGFAAEATPPAPPPRRPTPFALPPSPPSPALVGPVGDTDVRLGWHDPLPPTSTLPRFVPFCLERMAEFGGLLTVLDPHCAGLVT